jgi:hypothetical protein
MRWTRSLQVFLTSFALFFVETAMFHILQFTHAYLESTLVISDALLGLAFGSITAYFVRSNRIVSFQYFAAAFLSSIVLAFVNIVRFPHLVRLSTV